MAVSAGEHMSQAAGATHVAQGQTARAERPFWRESLAPYTRPRVGRSLLDLATSVVPYLALTAAMYALVHVSALLVVVLALPAAGFLMRTLGRRRRRGLHGFRGMRIWMGR